MFYEIDMAEEHIQSINNALDLVENVENIQVDLFFNNLSLSNSEYLKLKETMTGKRVEMMENIRDMIESRLAFDKSKADLAASMNKASPGYGDQAVKMMFPEGSFKSPVPAGAGEKDVMMMEQLIKNLQTKGRKENASGGLADMLGE